MSTIREQQLAYAARKWAVAVSVYDQHKGGFAGTFRFDTFAEAAGYLATSMGRHAAYREKRWELHGPGGQFGDDDMNRAVIAALSPPPA